MTTVRKASLLSIKKLEQDFQENAQEIHAVFKMSRDELSLHPAGEARINECYHAPMTWDVRMSVLNAVGGFHGVESIESTRGEFAEYLNAGDTYACTIIYWRGRYRVESLGDFIETMERQGIKFK